jgi:steroid 5-alpha reductase family enzyme
MFTQTILWGLLPKAVLLAFGVALVVTAIGFKRHVYFVGVGYGYAISGMALASLALAGTEVSAVTRIEAALLAVYGARLGTFLAIRDAKPSYRASAAKDGDRPAELAFGMKAIMWVSVSLFYVMLFLPLLARFVAESRKFSDPIPALAFAGIGITAFGVAIEGIGDAQKSAAKKKNPGRFCDSGLYRLSRCPNYFGEILVWTGAMMAGAVMLASWLQWVLALVGYLSIVFVMVGAARRLERTQEARYGADDGFRAYARKTPILVPFIPVYSLKKRD